MFAMRDVSSTQISAVAAAQLFVDQTPVTTPSSHFRLSRIPKASASKEEIQTCLQGLTVLASAQSITPSQGLSTHEDDISPDFKVSVASIDLEYSQAIVTFTSPIVLPPRMLGPHGHEIEIDDHFQGLTVLYANDAAKEMDGIVAE